MRRKSGKIIQYTIVIVSILGIISDFITMGLDQNDYVKYYYTIIQFFNPNISFAIISIAVTYWHKLCFYNWIASFHILFVSIHNLISIYLLDPKNGEAYDNSYMFWISIFVLIYLVSAIVNDEIKTQKIKK